jgi:hypothetical protein
LVRINIIYISIYYWLKKSYLGVGGKASYETNICHCPNKRSDKKIKKNKLKKNQIKQNVKKCFVKKY